MEESELAEVIFVALRKREEWGRAAGTRSIKVKCGDEMRSIMWCNGRAWEIYICTQLE